MRHLLSGLLALGLIFALLTGCSNQETAAGDDHNTAPQAVTAAAGDTGAGETEAIKTAAGETGTDETGAGDTETDETGAGDTGAVTDTEPGDPARSALDLDLTQLNGLLAYSMVVTILENPDAYVGKNIKLTGEYFPLYFEPTERNYHYIIVGDESLCCQVGMEFVWNGTHAYPDDYPDEYENIELSGTFSHNEGSSLNDYYLTVEVVSLLGSGA